MLDLLLPDFTVDGPRRVKMTVRPERVAFLVDPTCPDHALAAIESACLTWGGIHQFLIPCLPGERPDALWTAVLEKHDPDVIVDLVGVEEGFRGEEQALRTRLVDRWERPTETMDITGAVVYAALRRWKRTRRSGPAQVVINLHPLTEQPLALPLAFRLGHLDPRPMDRDMVIERSYRSGRIQDFVDLREIDPRRLGDDELRQLAMEVPLNVLPLVAPGHRPGQTDYFGLPHLTKIGLPSSEPAYYHGSPSNPEHEQHSEEFIRRIVVVGSPGSVEDLCLAWNLRAQQRNSQLFPQWISPDWMSEPDALQSIRWGLRWEPLGLAEEHRLIPLHLLSATLSRKELLAVSPEVGVPIEVHDRANLDYFFTTGFRVGHVQVSTAGFIDGTADITVPDYALLGDWEHWERIGWTGEIIGYHPPRLARRHLPQIGPLPIRAANDGLAGFIKVPHAAPGDLWSFPTISGWTMVAAVAEEAGYSARIWDKGQRAIALMQLFDGEVGLRLLASSRVYGLIERMAESIERRQAVQQAVRRAFERLDVDTLPQQHEDAITAVVLSDVTEGAQFDRQHYTWNDVKNALGEGARRDQCDRLIEWLVERRILFQGYKFTCLNCGLGRWYSINSLSDTQTCEGCGHLSRKPVSPNVLQWRYRLNETVAQAVDQGVLPHLLAVNQMIGWRHDERAPLYGYLPGVQLSPRVTGGPAEIEIDLLAIKGGRIIIGECKRGGDRITDVTVERFAQLGHLLKASRIIYATASTFDDDIVALDGAIEKSKPAVVERWDRTMLFDRFSHGGVFDPVDYLDRALR